MDNHTLRADIRACLKNRGISIHRLSQESGVDAAALWRFVKGKKPNLTTDSLFRIWPHLYGGQKPLPIDGEPCSDGPNSGSIQKPNSDLLALCLVILSFGSDAQKQALVALAESTLQAKTTSPAEGEES